MLIVFSRTNSPKKGSGIQMVLVLVLEVLITFMWIKINAGIEILICGLLVAGLYYYFLFSYPIQPVLEGISFKDGYIVKRLAPGTHTIIPFAYYILVRNVLQKVIVFKTESIHTKDKTEVTIDATLRSKIIQERCKRCIS